MGRALSWRRTPIPARQTRRSFYTDVTRARDAAVVVMDSSARLAQLVHSDRTQLAALDVVGSSGLTFERWPFALRMRQKDGLLAHKLDLMAK